MTKPANSNEAVARAKRLGTPTGDYLARVLRRHKSVGAWTAQHVQANIDLDRDHNVCDDATSRRCLRECIIPHAVCRTCRTPTVWPCKDAADAIRLLERLERDTRAAGVDVK